MVIQFWEYSKVRMSAEAGLEIANLPLADFRLTRFVSDQLAILNHQLAIHAASSYLQQAVQWA